MADIYWPFPESKVSEWPGERGENWADHIGTDFAIPQGTPLRATASGIVDIHWTDGLGAWVIDIHTPDGLVIRHGHLSYMAPKDGAWVNAGDYLGNTGGALGTPGAGLSTGPHLHWEIRNNPGWGAVGWYDPRQLVIHDFSELNKPKPAAPAVKRRRKSMATVYYQTKNDKRAGQGGTGLEWALAGDSPGTDANWLTTTQQSVANDWAAVHGNAVFLGRKSYAVFRSWYQQPIRTKS